jgi:uncharacterized protein YndB with AHSA1/START domain
MGFRQSTAVALAGLITWMAPPPATGEVLHVNETAFSVRHEAEISVASETAFKAITGRISEWWSADHSWSGNAANLYFKTGVGGCFCEKLPDGGGVEHLRVIYYRPNREIRLTGALGPLQQMGVNGAMSWRIEDRADGKRVLVFEYRVNGHIPGGANSIAPAVDGVIGEQHASLLALLGND